MQPSFVWYDLETFGFSPRFDRVAQFGAIRTDLELNVLEKAEIYCQPMDDVLPRPQSVAITGITPQYCQRKGVPERQFMRQIEDFFTKNGGNCIVGYNNIHFDDEFMRYGFYRNFLDPYRWQYQRGNSRWDLLDVVRMCYAYRREASLEWPTGEDGVPIFRLGALSVANGLTHEKAHDAMSDVVATVALARRILETQPKLFKYALSLRDKAKVEGIVHLYEPLLHTSGRYSSRLSCTRMVVPVARHPRYSNRVIVFNLDQDPSCLLDSDVESLTRMLFSSKEDLKQRGEVRVALKEIVFNRCPIIVNDMRFLEANAEHWGVDVEMCWTNLKRVVSARGALERKIVAVYNTSPLESTDVDEQLYQGFFSDSERDRMAELPNNDVALRGYVPGFKDKRLKGLWFRYRARHLEDTLSANELKVWHAVVCARLSGEQSGYLSLELYQADVCALEKEGASPTLVKALKEYGEMISAKHQFNV